MEAIFGLVEVLEVVGVIPKHKNAFFWVFWDESVDLLDDRKVIRLDAVASNFEQRRTDRPIGQISLPVRYSSF